MKPEVKVFDKANPCTKADIWVCFRIATGFRSVQVDEAHAVIGKNVPRVMERNGYLVKQVLPRGDYYKLTVSGEGWLAKGIERYVRNHPIAAAELPFLVTENTGNRRRMRNRVSL